MQMLRTQVLWMQMLWMQVLRTRVLWKTPRLPSPEVACAAPLPFSGAINSAVLPQDSR